MTLTAQRNGYWDSLKFLLIYMVVLGHVVGPYRLESQLNLSLVHMIYLFHMPLFVFISGHFSVIRKREGYKHKMLRLLETFLVFHLTWCLIDFFVFFKPITITTLISPGHALWYLLSLISWRLLIYFLPQTIFREEKLVIVCSFIIGIIGGFIPVSMEFSLQKTMAFLPFFMLGYYFKEEDLKKIHIINKWMAWGVIVAVFLLFYFFVRHPNVQFIITGRIPYYYGNENVLTLLLGRLVFYICAVILSVMVMRITPINDTFSKWGMETMVIYIYHVFFLTCISLGVTHGLLSSNLLLLFVYSIVITAILLLFSRWKLSKWMLNPVSNMLTRKNE